MVGGCEGGPLELDGSSADDEGSWNEGGVASGSVVNRIPVDTVVSGDGVGKILEINALRLTPGTSLLCTEVKLCTNRDPTFQPALYGILLINPFNPNTTARG